MSNPKNRSCLFVVLGLFIGVLLLIFVGGNVYSAWQLERAHRDLLALAQQLGYTPDAQLAVRLGMGDRNIVTGASIHTLTLYYVVAMNLSEFDALLSNVDATVTPFYGSSQRLWENFIAFIGQKNETQSISRYSVHPKDIRSWRVRNNRLLIVELYQIPESSNGPKYYGEELTGCLVKVKIDGATVPIWQLLGAIIWENTRGYHLN